MPEAAIAPERLAERLAATIAREGPIPIGGYMAQANAHYYATRDPFGTAGDFTTAPEISQMFGELVGAWLADLWARSGGHPCRYVELGPGRGTLAMDALRAMRAAGLEPPVELVETSPLLRARQAERLPAARWHERPEDLPGDGALLIVANEFFDALPIEQMIATEHGLARRLVDHVDGRFVTIAGPTLGARPAEVAPGAILESAPEAIASVEELAARIVRQGGALLIVDYGDAPGASGDTLQAVRGHDHADPFADPGEADLTAHVDFAALGRAAARGGASVYGPVAQGGWLRALGIDQRAEALARAAPARAAEVEAARVRLVEPLQMGELFKVMAIVAPGWARPAGF